MQRVEDYDRPSVAADAVVFGIDTAAAASPKGLRQRLLKLLLVKRGASPFEGCYSLPGGFLRKGETLEEAALRELAEESGVNQPKIMQFRTYSTPDRDPRGWVLSCAFLALTSTVNLATAADSDAAEACWMSFSYKEDCIILSDDNTELVLRYNKGRMLENPLAFDHAQIIYDGFQRLRDAVLYHDMIFDLMPERFAISDLQQPYEAITGWKTTPQNFRRRMAGKLQETEFYDEAAAHRTSKLYERKER